MGGGVPVCVPTWGRQGWGATPPGPHYSFLDNGHVPRDSGDSSGLVGMAQAGAGWGGAGRGLSEAWSLAHPRGLREQVGWAELRGRGVPGPPGAAPVSRLVGTPPLGPASSSGGVVSQGPGVPLPARGRAGIQQSPAWLAVALLAHLQSLGPGWGAGRHPRAA